MSPLWGCRGGGEKCEVGGGRRVPTVTGSPLPSSCIFVLISKIILTTLKTQYFEQKSTTAWISCLFCLFPYYYSSWHFYIIVFHDFNHVGNVSSLFPAFKFFLKNLSSLHTPPSNFILIHRWHTKLKHAFWGSYNVFWASKSNVCQIMLHKH